MLGAIDGDQVTIHGRYCPPPATSSPISGAGYAGNSKINQHARSCMIWRVKTGVMQQLAVG